MLLRVVVVLCAGLATCGILMSDRTGYCVGEVPQGMLPAVR